MYQMLFGGRAPPGPAGAAYSSPSDHIAALRALSDKAFSDQKCTKCRLAAGLHPDPLGDELTALPQTPLAALKLLTPSARSSAPRLASRLRRSETERSGSSFSHSNTRSPIWRGRDTLHFRHAFSNRTYFRPHGRISWLCSIQRAPRVVNEKKKKERKKESMVKHKSADMYVGRPNYIWNVAYRKSLCVQQVKTYSNLFFSPPSCMLSRSAFCFLKLPPLSK